MHTQFEEIATKEALEDVLDRSLDGPVVLYLHDPYCGLSAMAHQEVSRLGFPVACVDVNARHDLSMEVERLTGVRHESPQAFVLRDRRARWSASHRKVTASAILDAMATIDQPSGPGPLPSAPGALATMISKLAAMRKRDVAP